MSLKNNFAYSKFEGKLKVLFIDSEYFLIKELKSAVIELGGEYDSVKLFDNVSEKQNLVAKSNFIEELLLKIAYLRPDFIFCINLLGFDIDGNLIKLLNNINQIVVNWFVDNPMAIVEQGIIGNYSNLFSFVWEKIYIEKLVELYPNHHFYHLPYATGFDLIKPISNPELTITFVGNSMIKAVDKWQKLSNFTDIKTMDHIKNDLLEADAFDIEKVLRSFINFYQLGLGINTTYLFFLGSLIKRKKIMTILEKNYPINIFGDIGWSQWINKDNLHSEINYYNEVSNIYNNSYLNINITSPQMPTGINQRVFDVLASGGLLLTDYREDLEIIFDDKIKLLNIIKNENDLLDEVDSILSHPQKRLMEISILQKHIAQHHRYVNRLQTIISILKREIVS